ncbi:PREDICTED: heme-binding protein 2-like [Amphimedon queenslandica]|uniref:Heme-binding protein 2-like n=1 Tax=Amphimedon queenslandica TaxID=400682 RepID=A0A1X7VME5_AMPQE|nr:PREDICTED: heme-binding protein 2-like [Amphimedon queenslandica]|eukprot:XP_011409767.1 PREDICTED: heme-binding protein 2-like [Amphimedon queenslandica]
MKLIQTLGIASLLFTLISAASLKASDPPSFCHGLDCPVYKVTGKMGKYEIRSYEQSKWVGTVIRGDSFTQAGSQAFHMLFDYISGANSQNQKIPMAVPVATKVVPLDGSMYNFTVFFFVPFAFQANTPTPSDPKVFVQVLPALTAYVDSFSGFESNDDLKKHTEEMKAALTAAGVQYVHDFSFTAEYDSPFKIIDRHNEVWLVAA